MLEHTVKLDSNAILWAVIIGLILWKLLAKNKQLQMLTKIPGPKPYPFIGNALDILGPREEVLQNTIQRTKTYGRVYRMQLGNSRSVHLSEPEDIETVLHSSKHLSKGVFYKFVQPLLGQGLITSSGQQWFSHRKILTPAFHFKILDSFIDVFRDQSARLVKNLEKHVDGRVFDIYDYIKLCALDVICETAMGVKVNAQNGDNCDYVKSVLRITTITAERMRKLWLHPDFVFRMTSLGREYYNHIKSARDFVENVINERKIIRQTDTKSSSNRRLAFLDLILEIADTEKANLSDREIREEVDTFMFAGHDTITAAITWALYLIGHHKNIQDDLYREQQQIFGDDIERPITQDDINQMELLDRVMKESIRLYPSVPFISRLLDEDVKFGDYWVPKGTSALLHIYTLHRNPKEYPDPEKFDPDRFLPENVDKRHNYSYIPFSAGSRNCIGKRFALLEEKFLLSTLIRTYEFKSVDPRESLPVVSEIILRPLPGIRMTLKKRGGAQ